MHQKSSPVRAIRRRGFTLIELTIVVLILGILAAVAAPKMMNTATNAKTNGTRTSLSILRDALELYRSQNAAYPTQATIATSLSTYLNGPFPASQVGANQVATVGTATSPITAAAGATGWLYDQATGEIRVNDTSSIAW